MKRISCREPRGNTRPSGSPNGRASSELVREVCDRALRERFAFLEWSFRRIDGTEFSSTVLLTPDRARRSDHSPGDHQGYHPGQADGEGLPDQTPAAGRYQPPSTVAPHAGAPGTETQEHHRCDRSVVRRGYLPDLADQAAAMPARVAAFTPEAWKSRTVCRDRTRCLHLVASSGRYAHTDAESHAPHSAKLL